MKSVKCVFFLHAEVLHESVEPVVSDETLNSMVCHVGILISVVSHEHSVSRGITGEPACAELPLPLHEHPARFGACQVPVLGHAVPARACSLPREESVPAFPSERGPRSFLPAPSGSPQLHL
jgi:hypothetical protein